MLFDGLGSFDDLALVHFRRREELLSADILCVSRYRFRNAVLLDFSVGRVFCLDDRLLPFVYFDDYGVLNRWLLFHNFGRRNRRQGPFHNSGLLGIFDREQLSELGFLLILVLDQFRLDRRLLNLRQIIDFRIILLLFVRRLLVPDLANFLNLNGPNRSLRPLLVGELLILDEQPVFDSSVHLTNQ